VTTGETMGSSGLLPAPRPSSRVFGDEHPRIAGSWTANWRALDRGSPAICPRISGFSVADRKDHDRESQVAPLLWRACTGTGC
jgi:hypothetical protein